MRVLEPAASGGGKKSPAGGRGVVKAPPKRTPVARVGDVVRVVGEGEGRYKGGDNFERRVPVARVGDVVRVIEVGGGEDVRKEEARLGGGGGGGGEGGGAEAARDSSALPPPSSPRDQHLKKKKSIQLNLRMKTELGDDWRGLLSLHEKEGAAFNMVNWGTVMSRLGKLKPFDMREMKQDARVREGSE